jgi:hypothetical protein
MRQIRLSGSFDYEHGRTLEAASETQRAVAVDIRDTEGERIYRGVGYVVEVTEVSEDGDDLRLDLTLAMGKGLREMVIEDGRPGSSYEVLGALGRHARCKALLFAGLKDDMIARLLGEPIEWVRGQK